MTGHITKTLPSKKQKKTKWYAVLLKLLQTTLSSGIFQTVTVIFIFKQIY